MRQENLELGKVHRNIIDVDRIAVLVARSGKHRCACVKHHRDAISLSRSVDDLQFLHAGQVVIGEKKLVRRMGS